MRALLHPDGPDPATSGGLYARYRPASRSCVRANFIASADGAATVSGRSGALGSAADRAVFSALRDHADVILVGAGTVRAENYGAPDPATASRARRGGAGQDEVPQLAVVGRPSSWRGDERFIVEATRPPLLLTSAADAAAVSGCETVVCGDRTVDLGRAIDELEGRGLTSVLCEGGPGLFSQLADSGRLTELCLSVAAALAGPESGRIVSGAPWADIRPLTLMDVLEDEGLLLVRYAVG